jgi:hypothetical protein
MGFFPHRAGIEKDDVSICRIVCFFHALRSVKHIGHLLRVILVHLAAEGFDIKFLGHYYFLLIAKSNVSLLRNSPGLLENRAQPLHSDQFISYF